MNTCENQEAIDNFIVWVKQISDCVNSVNWHGEDVMGIFFNEFNRYKKKSESGQVFTPDHISSFMCKLINVDVDDVVLDAACGSGAFLVKSMCNMIEASGGLGTAKAKHIKDKQLYGIEFDREVFALCAANFLIHKDGKTNIEQMDTRSQKACDWIKSKPITKVLMNPPFERRYGCMTIVNNVLNSVQKHTLCAFILPDKKLEKDFKHNKYGNKVLQDHTLKKIIKLPEKTFVNASVTTSIFIFEAGVPHDNQEIFACYIEEDGLETVKNQGRHDVRDRWQAIEEKWLDIIKKQSGHPTVQWLKPSESLSYQMPEKPFVISESDFLKTMMDFEMYQQGINVSQFSEQLLQNVLYESKVSNRKDTIVLTFDKSVENKNGQ